MGFLVQKFVLYHVTSLTADFALIDTQDRLGSDQPAMQAIFWLTLEGLYGFLVQKFCAM